MKLTIKARLYLLSIVPLLIIAVGMLFFTRSELQSLNDTHVASSRASMYAAKKSELKSYMEIVDTVLTTLKAEHASLDEVVKSLSEIDFGDGGYIFGYDSKGKRVLLGKSTSGLGKNFLQLKDKKGFLFIEDIIKAAKSGGDFTTFYFPKPGEDEALPKLAYSVYEKDWDLVIGTGFYLDDIDKALAAMEKASSEEVNEALMTIITASLIVILLIGIFVAFISRSIINPLKKFDASIESFATGEADLTARMEDSHVPEFHKLAGGFNLFVQNLHSIIENVTNVSSEVVAETNSMATRAGQVDVLVKEQREETDQVATAMTEMTATAHEISENATQAASAAKAAESNANETIDIVSGAVSSVMGLADDVNQASQVVARLEGDVQNISTSLEVIQGIAEQTNLLALNAAIEAARAGEQGRGFAVVADEVRQLASRTQESTLDIHKMIEELKSASDDAVQTMEKSRTRSVETVDEASAASEALAKIQESINTIMDMNSLIATATEEQSQVGQDISQRIVTISDKSNESAELANTNATASQTLNHKALNLSELVNRFTV